MDKLAIGGGDPIWSGDWPEWPMHDQREIDAVTDVIRSGKWWRHAHGRGAELLEDAETGPGSEVARFCEAFARCHDCRFGIATANGTVSLEIALRALGIGPGDEVIVPAYTYVATASAVLTVNAVPIFVDIDPETCNIDPARVAEAVTDRTKAVIPVHFGGQPADMDAINAIARERGLAVLEDAAHAHGAVYNGRKAGSLADAGSFSFQASKPMTAGEGGIITANRDDVAEMCESLVWAGRKKGHPWYRHFVLASNARMTELQGAILSVQLTRLEDQIQQRMRNALTLDGLLSGIEGVRPCAVLPSTTVHTYHIYMLRYEPSAFGGMTKAEFVDALVAEGITVAMTGYGTPLYRNPMFLEKQMWGDGCPVDCPKYGRDIDYGEFASKCPVTERVCATEAVWLQQVALMGGDEHLNAIAQAIEKIQRHARRAAAGALRQ